MFVKQNKKLRIIWMLLKLTVNVIRWLYFGPFFWFDGQLYTHLWFDIAVFVLHKKSNWIWQASKWSNDFLERSNYFTITNTPTHISTLALAHNVFRNKILKESFANKDPQKVSNGTIKLKWKRITVALKFQDIFQSPKPNSFSQVPLSSYKNRSFTQSKNIEMKYDINHIRRTLNFW